MYVHNNEYEDELNERAFLFTIFKQKNRDALSKIFKYSMSMASGFNYVNLNYVQFSHDSKSAVKYFYIFVI